jgi:hypothetical protein
VGGQEAHAPLGLLPGGEGRRSGLKSQPAISGEKPLTATHKNMEHKYIWAFVKNGTQILLCFVKNGPKIYLCLLKMNETLGVCTIRKPEPEFSTRSHKFRRSGSSTQNKSSLLYTDSLTANECIVRRSDPTPSFTHTYTWKIRKTFNYIHISASQHCFIFLVSVTSAIIFNILGNVPDFSGRKKTGNV